MMRAALNKFFTPPHYNKIKRQGSREKFRCLKKIIGLLFFRFDDCGPFEGEGPSKCLQYLPSEGGFYRS